MNICALQVWDLRQNKLMYNMHGHGDSVTGLSLSSEGSYLLSNSMDNTGNFFLTRWKKRLRQSLFSGMCFDRRLSLHVVRIWDVRPFAPKERCVKIFQGNVHNFEKVLINIHEMTVNTVLSMFDLVFFT